MPTLIDMTGRVTDDWICAHADGPRPPPAANVLIPLALYREDPTGWRARPGRLGLLLSPADDPQQIDAELEHLSLVAIQFPSFTDGRGYSIARLLRERHHWRGELRAVGEVLRDQLQSLARCGFDGFALSDGVDIDQALAAFADFDEHYQADALGNAPFDRRGTQEPSSRRLANHSALRKD